MNDYLSAATQAARTAGALLKEHFEKELTVNEVDLHDIKLELDVRSQELITSILLEAFPQHAILGEEGIAGNQESPYQWIVDPIDGTVNFFYGIPHFCISIALHHEGKAIAAVIYDPMRDELWEAAKGEATRLNGKPCKVSARTKIGDAVVSVGFAKSSSTIRTGLPLFEKMIYKVRKCRLMGSAALDLAYVASGRLDAYIESTVNLWDIAAGRLLVEAAGGSVEVTPREDDPRKLSIVATSGAMDLGLDD
ncbi:MAG TPA: inositol monophosphatase family protein [Chthoniobacteraceae bacterium]|nr:inositol monophosphatase family protein [Chthoniobacteraceae bacterium]